MSATQIHTRSFGMNLQILGNKIADNVASGVDRIKEAVSGIFESKEVKQSKESIKNILSQIDRSDLKKAENEVAFKNLRQQIDSYVNQVKDPKSSADSIKILEEILSVIPCNILQENIRRSKGLGGDPQSALQEAKKMIGAAKEYLTATAEPSLSDRFKSLLRDVSDSLLVLIDTLLSAFGLSDLFEPPDNEEWGAHMKSHKIESLIPVLAAVVAVLAPVVSASTSVGLILAGIVLGLAALTIIYKKVIKPTPSHLNPHAENWTKYSKEGKKYAVRGRKPQMDEIAKSLIAEKPVLITGESGVGKTELVKGLVYAIEHTNDYPELKGKTFFYINTTEIAEKHLGDHIGILEQINRVLRRNNVRHKVVLIFDEIHNAYSQENGKAGQRFKSRLRGSEEKFPYVIGITTNKEYEEFIAPDEASVNRFDRIQLESTDKKKTKTILNTHLLTHAPRTFINEETHQYFQQEMKTKFPTDIQPFFGINLLDACIAKTGNYQKTPTELKKEKNEAIVEENDTTKAVLMDPDNYNNPKIEQARKDLKSNIKKIKKEAKEVVKLNNKRSALLELKQKFNQTTLKLKKAKEDKLSFIDQQNLKEHLLIKEYLQPALQESIIKRANELKIKVEITKEIVDEVINEEIKRRNTAKRKQPCEHEDQKKANKGKTHAHKKVENEC